MGKKIIIALSAILVLLVAGFGLKVYLDQNYLKEYEKDKIVGSDRYETMVNISEEGFTSAKEAVLVNSKSISDAICAVPFAKAKNIPIFFTSTDEMNEKILDQLKNLGVENIYAIGRDKAISTYQTKILSREGFSVVRIGGKNGFETSVLVAEEMSKIVDIEDLALVSIMYGMPDGVSLSSAAAKSDMPIILMKKSNRKEVIEFAKKHNIKNTYFIGSEGQFPQVFADMMPNTTRISGKDRFETNLNIIKTFYKSDEINEVYYTKGGIETHAEFLDTLSLAPIAAKNNIPILFAEHKAVTKEQSAFLKDSKIEKITQVGFELTRPRLITKETFRILNTIIITILAIITLKRIRLTQ